MAILGDTKTISATGDYDMPVTPGRRYALSIDGTWGSGASVAVKRLDGETEGGQYPDSPLSADGGFEFVATVPAVRITLATAASTLKATLTRIRD